MRLFHSQYSRSTRALWALYELSLPVEIVSVPFTPASLRSPEHLRVHPLGKVPTFHDGDLILHESGAIVEYLASRYGRDRIAPHPDSSDFGPYLDWIHFGEATLTNDVGLIARNLFVLPEPERSDLAITLALKAVRNDFAYLERHLSGRSFLVGEAFSAADIMVGYPLFLLGFCARTFGREDLNPIADYPSVQAFESRMAARPSAAAALAQA